MSTMDPYQIVADTLALHLLHDDAGEESPHDFDVDEIDGLLDSLREELGEGLTVEQLTEIGNEVADRIFQYATSRFYVASKAQFEQAIRDIYGTAVPEYRERLT